MFDMDGVTFKSGKFKCIHFEPVDDDGEMEVVFTDDYGFQHSMYMGQNKLKQLQDHLNNNLL